MKRILIIAILCLPISLLAQTKGAPTKPQVAGTDYSQNTMMYADIIVSMNQDRATVRLSFGDNYRDMNLSKAEIVKIENIKSMRFGNSVDALNSLNSLGFRYSGSYTVDTRNGSESHIIVEKSTKTSGSPRGAGGTTTVTKPKKK